MTLTAFVTALMLFASPPFPAPRSVPVTEQLRCDWGSVLSVDAKGSELVLTTAVGPLTLRIEKGVQVFGGDGQALTGVAALKPGTAVRAYYVVDAGAKLQEVAVEAAK
jgi:hypothetical protein